MNLKYSILTLIILLGCTLASYGEKHQPYHTFHQIDSRHGLPDNSVNAIAQDHRGYMWIGTWNGLSLYDGSTHHVFMADPDDDTALCNNMVRSLCPDTHGLWVGTDAGLEYLDFSSCHFRHCTLHLADGNTEPTRIRVNSIMKVDDVIFAIDNIGRLYRSTDAPYMFDVVSIGNDEMIMAQCPYDNHQFVTLTNKGIRIVEGASLKVRCALDTHTKVTAENANIYYSLNTGQIYVGNGLGYTGSTYMIGGDGSITQSQSFVPGNLTCVTDAGAYTYFATDGGGLWRADNQGGIINFDEINSNYRGAAIYSMTADSDHNLWIGCYRCGMWVYSNQFNMFNIANRGNGKLNFDIVSAITTTDKNLFVGLDGGGLEIIGPDINAPHSVLTRHNSAMPGDNVVCTLADGAKIWMGIYTQGLACYDSSTGAFEIYGLPPGGNSNIWSLCDDGKGYLWACGRSLYTFDKSTHKFEAVRGMNDKLCTSITMYHNHMYVTTRTDGIYMIDSNQRNIVDHYYTESKKCAIPGNNVSCLCIDSHGDFWFAVRDHGLVHWSGSDVKPQIIGKESGIPEQRINSITEDKTGSLWVGTDNGLYMLPYSMKRFSKINDTSIPTTFVYNASAQRGDTIYFGTTQGVLSFNILDVNLPNYQGRAFFHGIKVLSDTDKYVNLYDDQPEMVTLAPDENFITVYFSVPDLLNQHTKSYSYRLVGLEDSWHETEDYHGATYTNLNPGKYDLQVRYLVNDGQWSEASVLPITIRPYWYNSTLAKIIWWLLAIGIVIAAIVMVMRTVRLKHSAKIAEIEKQAATDLNNAKLDFYAQITHDLRTPAFLISAQLEGLLDNPENVLQVRRSLISSILTNSHKLNKMVNRIIDLRKMDQGYLTLVCQRADVEHFVSTLLPYYEALCSQKEMEFCYKHDPAPIIMDFDADKLEMIISNLISNAYKYTPEYGKVTLSLHDDTDKIIISVLDSGIGIVKEAQSKIFEKYVRTERGRKQSIGDGLGLAYVKEIVTLYGGTIIVNSEPNKGSEFIIQLPKWQSDTAVESEVMGTMSYIDQQQEAPPSETAVNPVATHTLLIIDDDANVAEVLARSLSSHFKIQIAKDGQEGYEMARSMMPECILTDIMMPKVDGLQMIKMIRDDSSLRGIKIAVFSAKESEDDIETGFNIGVDAWYSKPMSLKLLKMRLLKLLSKSSPTPKDYKPIGADSNEAVVANALSSEDEELLHRCRAIIDDNLNNPDFTLSMLAEQMAMSHSSLYKKVKRITGLSLIDMVNDYKIWKAVTLFQQGETNVTKVGEACGFHDAKVFRDAFKRKMGMPPKKYLQNL